MKREFKIFLTFFLIYLFFIQWYGWNEESQFSLTKAISDEGRFEIDSFYNRTGDRALYNNHYYSDKDPGLSFLSVPIYSSWKFIYSLFPQEQKQNNQYVEVLINNVTIYSPKDPGFFTFNSMILVTILTSCIFSALTVVLIYKISKSFSKNEKHRLLLTITYGLGTLAFPISLNFMGHATATFFSFLSFYLLFKVKHGKNHDVNLFVLSGLFAGIGIITEDIVALIAFFLFTYSYTIDRKKTAFFVLGLFIGLLPLLFYNFSIFNTPFDLTRAYIDRSIYISAYPYENVTASSEKILKNAIFPSDEIGRILRHFHFVTSPPNLYVILRLLIDPFRGILFYCPVLFLSFIGMFYMHKEYRTESLLILCIFISFLIVLSMRTSWWGGYGFGNRYLFSVIPFLVIPIIYAFKKANFKLILILVLISIFVNFLGLQNPEDYISDIHTMAMKKEYLEKLNTLEPFPNPLQSYYLPLFLKYGPRSRIFESISNGQYSIDIRVFPLSKESNFPFDDFYIPFLCLVPLLIICLLIWKSDLIWPKK